MSVQNCTSCRKVIEDDQFMAIAADGTLIHESCVAAALDALENTKLNVFACASCSREIAAYETTSITEAGDLVHAVCLEALKK